MKGNRGQATIETVAFFMTLTIMIVCLLGFTKWFLLRQKLLIGARHGALLYSSGRMTEEEVRQSLIKFFTTGSPTFSRGRLSIQIGSYRPDPIATIAQLDIVKIRYTSQSSWYRFTRLNPVLEEKCIIKHAVTFGPGLQPVYGPPVWWLTASSISG